MTLLGGNFKFRQWRHGLAQTHSLHAFELSESPIKLPLDAALVREQQFGREVFANRRHPQSQREWPDSTA